MNLKPIASNMTQVETEKYKILFSYETPVAYYDKDTKKFYETKQKWSRTTSRHINKWLSCQETEYCEQSILDDLLDDK